MQLAGDLKSRGVPPCSAGGFARTVDLVNDGVGSDRGCSIPCGQSTDRFSPLSTRVSISSDLKAVDGREDRSAELAFDGEEAVEGTSTNQVVLPVGGISICRVDPRL
jgi:hypothetical protein